MTQDEAKAKNAAAFGDDISRIFGILKTNLETQKQDVAIKQFTLGYEFALRALAIADRVAEQLIKD